MTTWHHTSIRLSAPFLTLLHDIAPTVGDRAAALRALVLLGAAHAGLPLNELRQEFGALLAAPLDVRVQAALTHLYLSYTMEEPSAHAARTAEARTVHQESTDSALHTLVTPREAAPSIPPISNDPFSVGLEV
jgi:hypothetical protein